MVHRRQLGRQQFLVVLDVLALLELEVCVRESQPLFTEHVVGEHPVRRPVHLRAGQLAGLEPADLLGKVVGELLAVQPGVDDPAEEQAGMDESLGFVEVRGILALIVPLGLVENNCVGHSHLHLK